MTSSAAWTIRSVFSLSSLPSSRLTSAAAFLRIAIAWMTCFGMTSRGHVPSPMSKWMSERARLRAVVLVGRDLDLAHRVGLDAHFGPVRGNLCSGHGPLSSPCEAFFCLDKGRIRRRQGLSSRRKTSP